MSFVSSSFIFFLTYFLLGTALLRGRARIWHYTIGSYLFYSFAFPPYVLILLASSVLDFRIGRSMHASDSQRKKRLLLVTSLVMNLGLLATFKYAGFFAQSLNAALSGMGLSLAVPEPSLLLPVGISFYTFQTLSYSIDIYQGRLEPTDSFLEFACFVAFFPQLVAGPIVRAREFLPQIRGHRPLQWGETLRGLELVLVGLFKKAVIADHAAHYVEKVYSNPTDYGGAACWLATFFFAIQIYGDFSGYTDVARGLGRVLGFEFPQNFSWPYFSHSIQDFWRRWHMTLSFWIRDYLYFSLGGSRVASSARYAFNLVATWFLCGLWHGAAWTFVLWGLYHGALTSLEGFARQRGFRGYERVPLPLRIAGTFVLVLLGWAIFRAQNVEQLGQLWSRMLIPRGDFLRRVDLFWGWPLLLAGLAAALHALTYRVGYDVDRKSLLVGRPRSVQVLAISLALTAVIVLAAQQRDFIYFAF